MSFLNAVIRNVDDGDDDDDDDIGDDDDEGMMKMLIHQLWSIVYSL